MGRTLYEVQGYAIVLDKVAFVTRVFEAQDDEGWQFNVRFASDVRLAPKFASRSDAELERSLFLKALRET